MSTTFQATHAREQLDDYLLALLHTKRATMLPLNTQSFYGRFIRDETSKAYRDYVRILDRIVPPYYPTCPLVAMFEDTLPTTVPFETGTNAICATYIRQRLPRRFEILTPHETGFLWEGYRRRPETGLRSIALARNLPRDRELYEHHQRHIDESGQECYNKTLFVLSDEGLFPHLTEAGLQPVEATRIYPQ